MRKWKLMLSVLAAAFTLSAGSVSTLAERPILLNYSNTGLSSSQVLAEGTTLVPLKPLAAAMGYTLSWDQTSKTAKLVRPEREVVFTVGSKSTRVNHVTLALTKTPSIIKGVVYVPLVSAVSALGGKTWFDNSNTILNIVDEPRFTVASAQGRTYWVSQNNGDLYYRGATTGEPERIGALPLSGSPFSHRFEIQALGQGSDLLLLSDKHYAMFNDFSNGY